MIKIIINNTILKDKFKEGDSEAYEYLIDNTETDEQTESLIALQNLHKFVPENNERYISLRNKALFSMGIEIDEVLQ